MHLCKIGDELAGSNVDNTVYLGPHFPHLKNTEIAVEIVMVKDLQDRRCMTKY